MREDMNKYTSSMDTVSSQRTEGELSKSAGATAKTVGVMVWKAFKTLFWICAIAGVLVFLSVMSFIMSFRNVEPPNISTMKLNYSSFLYLDKPDGTSTEYLTFYSNENRVWVEMSEIPQYMKTAQIAIEDHRFSEHKGVDWKGTLGAVYGLIGGGGGRGGSTLTQQLIKNLTGENKVSILRKIKEIFTALNLESGYTAADGTKKVGYTKEEILGAYLNLVNYGGMCQGVGAAAKHYFNKEISECSLAECALIAGITQNPYQFNPMIFPEKSKDRARVVLDRMLELSEEGELVSDLTYPITRSEYNAAYAELETMEFVGAVDEDEDFVDPDEAKWNDYVDTIFDDVASDLMEKEGITYELAVSNIYNAGYTIHSSVNMDLQNDVYNFIQNNPDVLPADEAVQLAFYMMDPYTGKVLAIVGRRGEHVGRRIGNYATGAGMMGRQSGSSIKPISPYAVGLMEGIIDYGTVLQDKPVPNYFGEGSTQAGPRNFSGVYENTMNLDKAIEVSQNAPAAWVCRDVTPEACYDFLVNKLHFTSLTEEDSHNISSMALGGQTWGVYLSEMVAGYQIYANGGVYHKPITYDYVTDHDGVVILDNRNLEGERVMSEETATIMNKLLQRPTHGANGTAAGWFGNYPVDILGKTGTTDDNYDLWFIGATPFCVAGIWNGYEYNRELTDTGIHKTTWKAVIDYVMEKYDWSGKSWILSDNVVQRTFCRDSGKLAGPNCFDTASGWYQSDKVPGTCNGGSDHISGKNTVSPSPSPSPSVSPSPSPSPSPDPSGEPSISPGPTDNPDVTPAPPPGPTEEPTPEPTPSDEPTPIPEETPTPAPDNTDIPIDMWQPVG